MVSNYGTGADARGYGSAADTAAHGHRDSNSLREKGGDYHRREERRKERHTSSRRSRSRDREDRPSRSRGRNDRRRSRSGNDRRRSRSKNERRRSRSEHDRRRSRSEDRRSRRPGRSRADDYRDSEEDYVAINPNLSASHARSRATERRRRKAQAECIRRAGGFQKLADQEGHETVRLFWDGFQWVAKTGQAAMMNTDSATLNATRKLRRLYFGNLPTNAGLNENTFENIIWNEMRNRNFCNDPNVSPVLYVWFAKDKGNYGFIEFATVEETERALTMDGMNCMGCQLRVSRPNDYSAPAMKPGNVSLPTLPVTPLECYTGTCMRVSEIVLPESIQTEIEYLDVLDDVREAFEKYGRIKSAAIVSNSHSDIPPDLKVGDVILEFVDHESLLACVQNMQNRKYEKRVIHMLPMSEEDYKEAIGPLTLNMEALEREAE